MTLYTVESTTGTQELSRFHGWFTSSSQALGTASEQCPDDGVASVYRWKVQDGRDSVCCILNGKLTYTDRWLVFNVWKRDGQVTHKRFKVEGKSEGWTFLRSSDHSSSDSP